jgi:DNA-binding response OmpR family regulator
MPQWQTADKHVLLIEDNADFAFGLRANLEYEGYAVTVADDGASGLRLAGSSAPDLILLDLMLPGIDGFELLRQLRDARNPVPVIVVSAKSGEMDRVAALRLGADDYVAKPFSLLELLERIRLRLEAAHAAAAPTADARTIRLGDVAIDLAARVVMRDGRQIPLRRKEHELLVALWSAAGSVVSKERLLSTIWGFHGRVNTRTLDFHIAQLRAKLEKEPSRPRYILTVRRVGYRMLRS